MGSDSYGGGTLMGRGWRLSGFVHSIMLTWLFIDVIRGLKRSSNRIAELLGLTLI